MSFLESHENFKAEFPTADHNAEDMNSFLSEVSKQSPITEALWVLEGLFFIGCIQWLFYKGTLVCSLTGSVLLAVELRKSSTLLQILLLVPKIEKGRIKDIFNFKRNNIGCKSCEKQGPWFLSSFTMPDYLLV